jgi:UDP-N-acetylglucosamine 1-carboxyvinyltransferase
MKDEMTEEVRKAQGKNFACASFVLDPSSFVLSGGRPLSGTVAAGGSKNATLPMMTASILADGPICLEGAPRLADVETLALVLEQLGVRAARTPCGLLLETVDPRPIRAEYELLSRMRAGFCVLGPLLARRGRAVVSLPGGCNIGDRPVNLHLRGLAALGATLKIRHGYVIGRARRLRGTAVDLAGPRGPTVTGTANVLSAAVLAEGDTTIRGAAIEPEIVDLGNFLNAMGARIAGLGTSTLHISGVRRLLGTNYRIIPDRIEVSTLLLAAAITRGSATVTGAISAHLDSVLAVLRQAGASIAIAGDRVGVNASEGLRPVDITAEPYPGIPTDVQAQWMALMSLTPGRCTIRDRVFPSRFLHVAELNRLGANIERDDAGAVVYGVRRLTGARVTACDLRASAALVLAGLAAEGTTIVQQIHHLDRGYERLDEKLRQLGAGVERNDEG